MPPDGSITSSAGVPFGAEEVKETLTEAKEKMENVVGEVKEAVVDAAKETVNVVTETVEKVTES